MKKLMLIVLVPALLLAAAYSAGAWYLGKQVESVLDGQYARAQGVPYLKIAQRDFKRGIFSSSETVTIEMFGHMFRLMENTRGNAAGADPAAATGEPLRLTVRTHIRHGPLADFSSLAAAVAISEVEPEGELKQEVAKVLGGRAPLTARTVYFYDGSGESDLSSPAFSGNFDGVTPGTQARYSWAGVEAKLKFSPDLDRYTLQGKAPGLEIEDGKSLYMAMTDIRFDGDSQRVFDDEPLLYAGTQRLTLGEMRIEGKGMEEAPIVLRQVLYDINVPVSGDYVDLVAKISARDVLVGKQNYGPAHYDFSLRRLHARTLARLYRALMALYADAAMAGRANDPAVVLAPIGELAMELFKHDPEIELERISFSSAHGEVRVSARAKFKGLTDEDFAQPPVLLGKLDASAEVALPEKLLMQMPGNKADTPEMAEMRKQMLQQQLAALIEQELVRREGAMVRTKLQMRDGQFTVNGKLFNPFTMRQGAANPHAAGSGAVSPGAGTPK